MTADRLRDIAERAYDLHVLASEELGVWPLPRLPLPTAGFAMSPRQHEVMRLVAVGKDNCAIAAELGVSEKTIRNAVTEAYACLGVQNRVMAAVVYREMCGGRCG